VDKNEPSALKARLNNAVGFGQQRAATPLQYAADYLTGSSAASGRGIIRLPRREHISIKTGKMTRIRIGAKKLPPTTRRNWIGVGLDIELRKTDDTGAAKTQCYDKDHHPLFNRKLDDAVHRKCL
jgi:hypothetical protein